jgi:hypothetical protein
MIKKIQILPPKREKLFIARVNDYAAPSGYLICNRTIEIKKREEIFLSFEVRNMHNFMSYDIDYPNLWLSLNLLDENFELVEENFKEIKENGVIIKQEEVKIEKFNFECILVHNGLMVDKADIYIV